MREKDGTCVRTDWRCRAYSFVLQVFCLWWTGRWRILSTPSANSLGQCCRMLFFIQYTIVVSHCKNSYLDLNLSAFPRTFPKTSCANVSAALIKQMKMWHTEEDCPNGGGEKCLYTVGVTVTKSRS